MMNDSSNTRKRIQHKQNNNYKNNDVEDNNEDN